MARTAELDIPGIQLQEGDHTCAFYRGEEELAALLVPWVAKGLEVGDRCFCVVEEAADGPSVLRDALRGRGADVEQAESDGLLEIRTDEDVYLRRSGHFNGGEVFDWLQNLLDDLTHSKETLIRSAGVMRWIAKHEADTEEIFAYESRLNELLPAYPFIGICFYDLDHVTGGVVMRILETHPKVLMSGMLFNNPYFVPPKSTGIAKGPAS